VKNLKGSAPENIGFRKIEKMILKVQRLLWQDDWQR